MIPSEEEHSRRVREYLRLQDLRRRQLCDRRRKKLLEWALQKAKNWLSSYEAWLCRILPREIELVEAVPLGILQPQVERDWSWDVCIRPLTRRVAASVKKRRGAEDALCSGPKIGPETQLHQLMIGLARSDYAKHAFARAMDYPCGVLPLHRTSDNILARKKDAEVGIDHIAIGLPGQAKPASRWFGLCRHLFTVPGAT